MMRDLAISYGNSRQAKKWVNKTISFDALKERLKTTIAQRSRRRNMRKCPRRRGTPRRITEVLWAVR